MPLTVKAYFKKNSGTTSDQEYEIRRFGIDEDVSTSYEYLINKIIAVFPEISRNTLRLYWKDNDGDQITFSSDEELIEALSSVHDGVFKVYFEASVETEAKGHHHEGVVCDGCEGPIYGIRYKCNSCHDYDLCQKCKSKGMHPEHSMREIEQPANFGPHLQHNHFFPTSPPPPFAFPWNFGDCHPHHNSFTGFSPPFNCGFPFSNTMANGAFCHTAQHPGNLVKKAWKRYWKSLYKGSDDRCEGRKKCRREGPCKGKEEPNKKECQNGTSSSSEDDKVGIDGPMGSDISEQFMNSTGKSLADFLLPFVSKVEVDIKHDGKRMHCDKFSRSCQRKGKKTAHGCGRVPDTACSQDQNDEKDELHTVVERGSDAMEVPIDDANNKGNDSDWTFVKKDENIDNGVNESAEGIQKIQLVEGTNPAIVTSLSQMHSMGFYDDGKGGSLYEMMARLGGNVEAAIEEINNQRVN